MARLGTMLKATFICIFCGTCLSCRTKPDTKYNFGPPKYSEPNIYSGKFTFGFEISGFYPCGMTDGWDIDTSEVTGFRAFFDSVKFGKGEENRPYYIEVEGALSDSGFYGHMGSMRRILKLKKLIRSKEYENECK